MTAVGMFVALKRASPRTFAASHGLSPNLRGGNAAWRGSEIKLAFRPNAAPCDQAQSLAMEASTLGRAKLALSVGISAASVCRRAVRNCRVPEVAKYPIKWAPVLEGPCMRVVVFGATGYIGRAVVKELAARGHVVIAVTRQYSGINGNQTLGDAEKLFDGAMGVHVVVADVTDFVSVQCVLSDERVSADAAVCCLASRSGGRKDSFDIDYRATVNCIKAARLAKISKFVLLSAVCVQRPLLAFQEAKLLAEKKLMATADEMSYSIVRPTAFFKSLLGQVKSLKGGSPFVIFGDGESVLCKPISEADLASFIADCLWDPAKKNAVLPIGGPGPATSFKQRAELFFQQLGKKPRFFHVPYTFFDILQRVLDFGAGLFPEQMADTAEFGRIWRYYAEQSMLVLDPVTGEYRADMTPEYGTTCLNDFLVEALREGSTALKEQRLGAQSVGVRLGLPE